MLFIPPCAHALRGVKLAMASRFPGIPSSHLTEALAAAVGYGSNAALGVVLWKPGVDPMTLSALEFDDQQFNARLGTLGHDIPAWVGFDSFARATWVSAKYSSSRKLVARNLMVAGVLSGLAQGIFTLEGHGNLWGGEMSNGRMAGTSFHVWMPSNIPARAWVSDFGYGELSLHVACYPTGRFLDSTFAGYEAGEVVASGWVERELGKWITVKTRSGVTLMVRRKLVPVMSNSIAPSLGFADHGRFIL